MEVASIGEALKKARYLQSFMEPNWKSDHYKSEWRSETTESDSDQSEEKIQRDMECGDAGKTDRSMPPPIGLSSEKRSRLSQTSPESADSESDVSDVSLSSHRRRRNRRRPRRRSPEVIFWNSRYRPFNANHDSNRRPEGHRNSGSEPSCRGRY
jgi:hypothetical protein